MTDMTLLERWRRTRDATAFREIVARHAGMVYGTCCRILRSPSDAEDVAQECFEVLATKPEQPSDHLGAWLHRVATNRSISRLRSDRRRRDRDERFGSSLKTTTEIEWDDIYGYVDEAIEALPEKFRAPLTAVFLENQSKADVARAIQVDPRTVSYRVDRGIELIRETLRKKGVTVPSVTLASLFSANAATAAPRGLTTTLSKLAIAGAVSGSAPGIGAAAGGIIAMKKTVIGIGLLVAAAIGVMTTGREEVRSPESPARERDKSSPDSEDRFDAFMAVVDDAFGPVDVVEVDRPAPLATETGGGAVSGRVFDAESGEGVAGVVIEAGLSVDDRDPIYRSQPTDATGAYAITGLAPQRYFLTRTTPEGYRRPTYLDRAGPVNVVENETIGGIDFSLRAEALLAGIVVDESGRPVAGANVSLAGGTDFYVGTRAVTPDDGTFAFHGLPPSGDLWLRAFRGDHFRSLPVEIELQAEGKRDVRLMMFEAGTVSGIVIDEARSPLANVLVAAKLQEESRVGGGTKAETGADGRFRLTGLIPGNYKILLRDAGRTFFWSDSDSGYEFSLARGEHIQELTLTYAGSYSIVGHVYDAEGEPMAGVEVSAGGFWLEGNVPGYSVTDADGRYEIRNLGDGRYDVQVSKVIAGRRPERKDVQAGRDDVDFILREAKGATLAGRVVDAGTGEPIRAFELYHDSGYTEARGELWSGRIIRWTPHRDEGGAFNVNTSRMGYYVVAARAAGYATVIESFELREGDAVENVELALPRREPVSGLVTDVHGRPIAGAYVFYGGIQRETVGRAAARTDDEGWFELESFPTNDQRVAAFHPDYAPETIAVAGAGDLGPLHLVLEAGGTIEGVIRTPESQTGRIHVQIAPGPRQPAYDSSNPAADGVYELDGLPSGAAELMVAFMGDDTRRILSFPVQISAGQATIYDIDVPPATGAVEGRIAFDWERAEGGYVRATVDTASGREYLMAVIGEDGAYRLATAPGGSGSLQVVAELRDGGKIDVGVPLEIEEGAVTRLDVELRE